MAVLAALVALVVLVVLVAETQRRTVGFLESNGELHDDLPALVVVIVRGDDTDQV
ncbi:MAG: hypothetical protein H0T42_01825 [Deltaproteobacteria bacterium]|nr:hypothetical protein [Deltaproteobacteria bacterium]